MLFSTGDGSMRSLGTNDAGKTNILEAVASAFGSPEFVRDAPLRPPRVEAVLELELPADDRLLVQLLFMPDASPFFPTHAQRSGASGLRWCGPATRRTTFKLLRPLEPPSLSEALALIHQKAARKMGPALQDPSLGRCRGASACKLGFALAEVRERSSELALSRRWTSVTS